VSEDVKNGSAWAVRCDKDDNGRKKFCEIFSSILIKETGVQLVEFAIGYPPDAKGSARGVVTLPLGMMLESGATMKVDDGDVYSFRMRNCSAKGCHALLNLNDNLVKQFKAGNKVTVTFVLRPLICAFYSSIIL